MFKYNEESYISKKEMPTMQAQMVYNFRHRDRKQVIRPLHESEQEWILNLMGPMMKDEVPPLYKKRNGTVIDAVRFKKEEFSFMD